MSLLNSEQGATEVTMMELATEGLQKEEEKIDLLTTMGSMRQAIATVPLVHITHY